MDCSLLSPSKLGNVIHFVLLFLFFRIESYSLYEFFVLMFDWVFRFLLYFVLLGFSRLLDLNGFLSSHFRLALRSGLRPFLRLRLRFLRLFAICLFNGIRFREFKLELDWAMIASEVLLVDRAICHEAHVILAYKKVVQPPSLVY